MASSIIETSFSGLGMIFIPGGSFISKNGEEVTVRDFWIDETPVTVAQYREAVKAGACLPPCGKVSNYNFADREDHPINGVSFWQARAYANWAYKRLLNVDEWEWAARGGYKARRFPWGNELPFNNLCWNGKGNEFGKGKRASTCPVGSYPQSDSFHGVKDMAGNVAEWVDNSFRDRTFDQYEDAAFTCGGGFDAITDRVLRAGTRIRNYARTANPFIGFRCGRSA